MNGLYEKLDHCLLCGSKDLELVLPLAPIPIATPNFSVPEHLRAAADKGVPLDLFQCRGCGHLQVGHVGNPEFQYRDYVYTTSLSPGLTEHFERYEREVFDRLAPPRDSLAVELGSNDGTLLRFFKNDGLRVLGVDPAVRIARDATRDGIETIGDFFSEKLAQRIRSEHGPASIVLANNMIANIHDLDDYTKGVRALLADDGAFVFETQYGADVVERHLLDTVYHEHLSYFRVAPLATFFPRYGMKLLDVARVPTKGGSLRVTVGVAAGPRKPEASVAAMLEEEARKEMYRAQYFRPLLDSIAETRRRLTTLADEERGRGRDIAGWGVSVGTTTLLAQFDLNHRIAFLVDDDPKKEHSLRGPDYEIPVLPVESVATRKPAAIVIFAWRYADAIVARNQAYLNAGGTFLIPLPDIRAVAASAARS